MTRLPFIRYRLPTVQGPPLPGLIIMGTGRGVRSAYVVLGAVRTNGTPGLGVTTWRVTVERMSAAAGRAAIAAGMPHADIRWDRRKP